MSHIIWVISRKSMISTSRRSTIINKCTFCNSCIFRCTIFVLLVCLTTVLLVSQMSKVSVFPTDMSWSSVYFPSNEPKSEPNISWLSYFELASISTRVSFSSLIGKNCVSEQHLGITHVKVTNKNWMEYVTVKINISLNLKPYF